jgi:bacterioferritin-associated ferredoxin
VYVCICRAVTTQAIKDLIADGARRTAEVGERCGAGTDCFKCRPTIRRLITQYLESASDTTDDAPSTASRSPTQARRFHEW